MESESLARCKDPSEANGLLARVQSLVSVCGLAFGLAGKSGVASFLLLVAERVLVGLCDLLLAGAMYLLFMLLQGASPAHHGWWTPKNTLSAAFVTAALVLFRVLLDLFSTRSVVGHIQELYTDLLLRLTHGYNKCSGFGSLREIVASF